jgi:hypothetical protein
MSSYDSFLGHELARHHAALDRAERLADERRERLPETLPRDIDESDLGLLFEIIGGDEMLGQQFRELLSFAMDPARSDDALCTAARSFGSELVDVCTDLCIELDRDSLPWDHAQVIAEMPTISERRLAERLRAASFERGAA